MEIIKNQIYDEERALYNLKHTALEKCVFEGPADGESALKEANDIAVKECVFRLRYPLWHVEKFRIENRCWTNHPELRFGMRRTAKFRIPK